LTYIFARLKEKVDKDIKDFMELQTNKDFAIKLLIRYGISKFGKKTDLSQFKDEIGKKGMEAVFKDLK
jgi:hypothetical protein